MPEDSTVVTLPQTFFDALAEQGEKLRESLLGNEENSQAFYDNNIITNKKESSTIFKPFFDFKDKIQYEKIGEAIFRGGAKAFFDYWENIKKKEDYYKVEDDLKQQGVPVVNNIEVTDKEPAKKKDSKSSWEDLFHALLIGGAAMLIKWIAEHGTDIWAQGLEVLTRSAKLLFKPIENAIKAFERKGNKLAQYIRTFGGNIRKLTKFFGGDSIFGRTIGKAIKFVGNAGGNLINALTKTISGIFSKGLRYFKVIPFIGTLIGLYQAWIRFQKGEWVKGAMELVAILPGVGVPLSIGLNALLSLMDSQSWVGGGFVKTIGSIGLKGGNILLQLGKVGKTIGGTLIKLCKRFPLIGSLISFGTAAENFSKGHWRSGIYDTVSGIVGLVPIWGPVLSLAVDGLKWLFGVEEYEETQDRREKARIYGDAAKTATITDHLKKTQDIAKDKADKVAKNIGEITDGNVKNIAEASDESVKVVESAEQVIEEFKPITKLDIDYTNIEADIEKKLKTLPTPELKLFTDHKRLLEDYAYRQHELQLSINQINKKIEKAKELDDKASLAKFEEDKEKLLDEYTKFKEEEKNIQEGILSGNITKVGNSADSYNKRMDALNDLRFDSDVNKKFINNVNSDNKTQNKINNTFNNNDKINAQNIEKLQNDTVFAMKKQKLSIENYDNLNAKQTAQSNVYLKTIAESISNQTVVSPTVNNISVANNNPTSYNTIPSYTRQNWA